MAAISIGVQLEGDPVEAIWDRELCPAMIHARTAVHEERVLDALCGDLGDAAARAPARPWQPIR